VECVFVLPLQIGLGGSTLITELKNGTQVKQVDIQRGVVGDITQPLVPFGQCWNPQLVAALRHVVQQAKVDCQDWGRDVIFLLKEAGYVPVVLDSEPVTLESKIVLPVHMTVLDEHGVPIAIQFRLVVRAGHLAAIGSENPQPQTENRTSKGRRQRQHRRTKLGQVYRGSDHDQDGNEEKLDAVARNVDANGEIIEDLEDLLGQLHAAPSTIPFSSALPS
jgi:hypothetical protein